jgi:hypothetical protein
MGVNKHVLVEDLPLVKTLLGSEGTVGSLATATSLERTLVRKRIAVLRKLGVLSPKPGAARTYVLTSLGDRLAETGDVHLVEPYSTDEDVPLNLGFRFAVGEGLFTGDVATSYRVIATLLGKADTRSLVFHLYRGDFERWAADVFRDKRTAAKLKKLMSRQMPPDHVRSRLIDIFSARPRSKIGAGVGIAQQGSPLRLLAEASQLEEMPEGKAETRPEGGDLQRGDL